jgi:hypothetical protein
MVQAPEDKIMDRLLKAQIRRAGVTRTCAEFDADLATAYLERGLNPVERGRYEHHLIDCHICRGMVSRLALLDESSITAPYSQLATATSAARSTADSAPLGWLARLQAALSAPQWALAVAAVMVVAISIPVLFLRTKGLSRMSARTSAGAPNALAPSQSSLADGISKDAESGTNDSRAVGAAEQRGSGSDEERNRSAAEKSGAGTTNSDASSASSPAATGAERRLASAEEPKESEAPAQPAAANALALAKSNDADRAAKDGASSSGATVSKKSPDGADDSAAADKTSGAEASSGSRASDRKQNADLPRLDPNKALHLPDDSGSASVSVLRHGQVSDQPQPSKEKVAAIKPDDSVAPAPEARAGEGTERGRHSIGKQPVTGFVSGSGVPADDAHWNHGAASTSPKLAKGERRIEGKRFRLINGVWTDKEFKSDKELPSITLVRGSDVYNSLLEKESSLKAYFGGFGATERAILIYKKIVYRLLPAEAKD